MTDKRKESKEIKTSASAVEDLDSLEIPDGYECPITQELMQDPVMAADGHSYEKTSIEMWFRSGKKTSPLTGAKLPHTLLTPNHNLKKAIADFMKKRPTLEAIKKMEREQRTKEDEMRSLEVAIRLREEDLAARMAKLAVTEAPKAAATLTGAGAGTQETKEEKAPAKKGEVKVSVGAAELKEGIDKLLEAANRGDANAQFMLGYQYEIGKEVSYSLQKAMHWYELAVAQNHPVAMAILAAHLLTQDYEYEICEKSQKLLREALPILKARAADGNAYIHLGLGECFYWLLKDEKTNTDSYTKEESFAQYLLAAEQGNALAQYHVGIRYYSYDAGAPKDISQAFIWFKRAAEQGYVQAQYKLAQLYRNGSDVSKDPAQAVMWCKRAAEQGYVQAQYKLAQLYENGSDVSKDPAQAVMWYKRAAEQGYPKAQHALGICYGKGIGVVKDLDQATRWLLKAAEQNNANAKYDLGSYYKTRDEAQALVWYRRAAEQKHKGAIGIINESKLMKAVEGGDPASQYKLGAAYQKLGEEKQAAEWFQAAAEEGYAQAQYALGKSYEHGNGVDKDLTQSAAWYKKAADQGLMDAQLSVGECFHLGLGVTQDMRQAVEWYQRASEQGHLQAKCYLGHCYAYGLGVTKDIRRAAVLFQQAIKEAGDADTWDAHSSLELLLKDNPGLRSTYTITPYAFMPAPGERKEVKGAGASSPDAVASIPAKKS